ncbi:MAG: zinc ribbon domain-containing protein, partial [Myxococcales bacterium]|nr:zinc ribbon domain-containing protein [Myxococcales bacterium]
VCEKCNGTLERAVTAAAFHLKGGGWYKDGYASAKAEGGDSKSETKTESKPAESKPAESKSASDSGSSTTSAPAKAASE